MESEQKYDVRRHQIFDFAAPQRNMLCERGTMLLKNLLSGSVTSSL